MKKIRIVWHHLSRTGWERREKVLTGHTEDEVTDMIHDGKVTGFSKNDKLLSFEVEQ